MNDVSSLPKNFHIGISYTEIEVVIDISGELNLVSSAQLGAVFDTLFDRGHESVVLDLAELGFIDGRGLQVVANAARRLQSSHGALMVRSPSAVVRRLLDLNGLAQLVHLEPEVFSKSRLGPEQKDSARKSQVGNAHTGGRISNDSPFAVMPIDREVLDRSLQLVVNLAKMTVGGAHGVSVSLLRDGQIMTVAASDQTIMEMDADQYATGEGPCLDASTHGHWFHINSLEEETRWPAFVPRARTLGIHAILSNPLTVQSHPVGALNIYSRNPAAFGPAEQKIASAFATETSVVLSDAGIGFSVASRAQRLHDALRSREIIAQAQGILMERESVGEEAAFNHLRRISQQSARPLRERAENIVASTHFPAADPPEITKGLHD